MQRGSPPKVKPHNYDALVKPFELTTGGLAKLLPDEIEITSKEEAVLYACNDDDVEERLQGGRATLTTHRILWSERSRVTHGGVHVCIHLSAVMLSVKGRDDFFSHMESALARKAWVVETAAEVMGRRAAGEGGGGGSRASAAGVAGILRRQEANRKATAEIATEAFSDLKSLIDKAKEVVAVVERYSAALQDKQTAAASAAGDKDEAGDGGDPTREAEDLSSILQDIGIASPVTKTSAGTRYHQQLARQLADFLSSPPGKRAGARTLLDMFGGMMTLPDVFSVFNRARGTELVSPADLLATARLLGPTKLGMSLRRFASGVLVIQADSHSDQAVSEKLVKAAEAEAAAGGGGWGDGLVATQVARDLRVSATLAVEHLRTAETAGLLCRDESVEGTRFYANPFERFVKSMEEAESTKATTAT
ncbi:conserved unknown protein [Ectocarpus siliculosus]|uniref:Vacuolar protein-sorting-associated protein 36 n=1 Tax=Ectocarpus siliculosus TaxID=2880 RepID=D7FWH2_ECTSI|nr:conserved unknown protein [Ectocarpus siliculosus]|eukprot:CBJ32060.1 conserved unknown protein [Ectocarpus siliculosus]